MFNARENEIQEPHTNAQKEIRVLIVDDHAILRAGVREMLSDEEDLRVVAEAGSAVICGLGLFWLVTRAFG